MKRDETKIGELADPSPGSYKIGPFGSSLKKNELVKAGIAVAAIENVLPNNFVPTFRKFITPQKFEELADYQVRTGDILVTTMGTIGRAAVVPAGIRTTIIDSHLFRMRVDGNRVYPPYLCFAINGYSGIQQQLNSMARGAIMDGLNTTILKECTVPLPMLDEQKRITTLLEKANRLRRSRRYVRELSDTFLQSVFLEMFGSWDYSHHPLQKLSQDQHGSFVNGPFGSDLLTSELTSSGVPVVYIRDIVSGVYKRVSTVCVTERKATQLSVCKVLPGDVLIAKVGDPPGTAAIYPESEPMAIITQDVIRIRVNRAYVTPEYLSTFLNSPKGYQTLEPIIVEGTRARFGLTPYKELPIPVPPLTLQDKFADVVRRYDRLRNQQREAERQAEHLFQTLLHRAFADSA